MLKIKDNLDLKELEKYGFEKDWFFDDRYTKIICEGRRGQEFILIINNNKTLAGYSEGADGDGEEEFLDNTLYDLIKDGLVEKVEG